MYGDHMGQCSLGIPSLPPSSSLGVGNANELRDTGLSEDAISTPTLQIRD